MTVDFDVVDALAGLAEDLRSEGYFVARIHDAVATMKKERDEARAEVERLQKARHTRACTQQSAYNLSCVCGADKEQRDRERAAYEAGAEAMRAAVLYRLNPDPLKPPLVRGFSLWDEIKHTPIPEDKR